MKKEYDFSKGKRGAVVSKKDESYLFLEVSCPFCRRVITIPLMENYIHRRKDCPFCNKGFDRNKV